MTIDPTKLRELHEAAEGGCWRAQSFDGEIVGIVSHIVESGRVLDTPTNGIVAAGILWPTEFEARDATRAERNAELIAYLCSEDTRTAILTLLAEHAALREALGRCRTIVLRHNRRQNEKVDDVVHIVNRALGE